MQQIAVLGLSCIAKKIEVTIDSNGFKDERHKHVKLAASSGSYTVYLIQGSEFHGND